jgi:hypothetical protein
MEITLDTTVVFRTNVPIDGDRADAKLLSKRLEILKRIRNGQDSVLISERLLHEYVQQVVPGKNDFVRAFLEIVASPDGSRVILNWKKAWSGGERDRARKCRYPKEDDHVLRTAIRDTATTIYSEEGRMTQAHPCVYKEFGVRITAP